VEGGERNNPAETLAGKVPVELKSDCDQVLGFGQQLDLAFGFLPQAFSLIMIILGTRVIVNNFL
jgi:hypothetical protein